MIARQRPVEDLISLFLLLGPASQIVLENAPNINRDDLITRGADLLPMLRAESPEFDAFARSMSDSRESIEWTRKLTDSYLQASREEGFDIEEYVSGHPEVLSLTVDQYWLAKLVTSKATGDELENLIAAVWGVRVALFDWRHRRK